MTPQEYVHNFFDDGRVMQIATIRNGAPSVVSVYYVASVDDRAVYWMSELRRRHSQDIKTDVTVAGTIVIKADQPVVGLQFSGRAAIVDDEHELRYVIDAYNEKYDNVASGLFERIQSATNKHSIYKLSITSLELFDGVHFPSGDTVEIV